MFHPGKVLVVFSPSEKLVEAADSSVQALLEMWDGNVQTVSVDSNISSKVKSGDIVLVDYTATGNGQPVPKLMVTKILRGEIGKKALSEYERFKKHAGARGKRPEEPFVMPQGQNYVR